MSAKAPAYPAARRRRHIPPTVVTLLEVLVAVALILWLTRLVLLEPQRLAGGDFGNHSWYIRHQADALRTTHGPSLFLNAGSVAFYPLFVFYGGTLYVVAGALSLLIGGSAYAAEAIIYVVAVAAAYGAWYWLARMAGVRGWLAHAPGVVYVTAPCVLTTLYAAQDLPETVATAAMPLMVASALSVGRSDRLRLGPAVALAVSTIAFTGSHNLTLLWGTIILVLGAALVAAAVPSARSLISRRGAARILVVVAPAVAVNAWFLLPDLIYSHDTAIAQRVEDARFRLRTPSDGFTLSHLLTPGRPDIGDDDAYTMPVLAVAWALLTAAMFRSRRGTPWLPLLVVLTLSALAITVLMSQMQVLADLPSPFILIQFGGRLGTFALSGFCGALIAALALADRPKPWLAGLLAAVLVAGVIQAADQVRHVKGVPGAELPLEAVTIGLGDYADGTAPIIRPARSSALEVRREDVHNGRAVFTLPMRPGTKFLTNVTAPTSLVHVEGAHVIGRWRAPPYAAGWLPRWYLAMQIPKGARGRRHTVVISSARSVPIVAGEIISIMGLLGLTAIAARLTWRRIVPS
jgi:hypothetical protein